MEMPLLSYVQSLLIYLSIFWHNFWMLLVGFKTAKYEKIMTPYKIMWKIDETSIFCSKDMANYVYTIEFLSFCNFLFGKSELDVVILVIL